MHSFRPQSSSKKVYTREEWQKKLNDVKIRKADMNKLVMNFFVTEGYVEAAEKFHKETGTEPDMDLGTITDRMEVRKAIQCGNVQDAIEKVNDLNPEILDTNPQLFFHLQQQRLIELIRSGKVEEALEFAQEELAPRGEENSDPNFSAAPMASGEGQSNPSTSRDAGGDHNEDADNEYGPPLLTQEELREMEHRRLVGVTRRCIVDKCMATLKRLGARWVMSYESLGSQPWAGRLRAVSYGVIKGDYNVFKREHAFLQELERTVALLAFEDTSSCPVGELLDVSQRQKTASELNAAILTSQSHEKDPKLPGLLKMLIWVQNQLDEKVSYPRINDLATAALEDPVT
ncbi:hypothetical protein L7F22_032809 [Adiantum nelumboides]|nr:hypothetical protein [Adiantum nelumboides]